jgi:hypothetical protein
LTRLFPPSLKPSGRARCLTMRITIWARAIVALSHDDGRVSLVALNCQCSTSFFFFHKAWSEDQSFPQKSA